MQEEAGEFSTSWHSYPSIYALGHRALGELFLDPVVVEEKVDGSQFSVVEDIIRAYATKPRWEKAVQHLRDAGKLDGSPKDIGALMAEVPDDVAKESADEIREALWKWAWPKIRRGLGRGLPEWYKERLLVEQFRESTDQA